ncbi:MAG: FlgD immunoglobulin-like domain containing protein, partial [Candidatus Krumholzibacteriia bacterium]
ANLWGRITATVEPFTVGDAPEELPLRDTRLSVGPSGLLEFGFTDPDGNFDVQTASIDSVSVFLRLAGKFARIFNDDLRDEFGNRTTPRIDARMLPGSPTDFLWDDSNSRASEQDAYYHTLVAHAFIVQVDPSFTALDYVMPVVVDITGRDCNAFWDGFQINFMEASDRCANTARISDVVYHEYGHGITDFQYRPLAPSGAMHEAFSDYIAATMTDHPLIGNGFFGPGTSIRSVENTRRYPDDLEGEVHIDGLILAGALWDLRVALGAAKTDTLFHFARYGLSDSFDDYMLDVLVTDDDNANIYDGTPNFDAIVQAFMAHGIGDYSVQITHAPTPDTEDLDKPLTITATFLSIFPLDPTSVQLDYRIGGGEWGSAPMTATGSAIREYAVTLPQQPSGTTIEYYLSAADTQGRQTTLPENAPGATFAFSIGPDTTPPVVVLDPLPDRPLDAPGWPLRVLVTDNLDRGLAGVTLRYSRNSTSLDQALAFAPGDPPVWSAKIPVAGAALGDVLHYALTATDSASTPNVARVPSAGTLSFTVVQGFLREFDANDGGLTPTGEWEWGAPTTGPGSAFSGDRVWATVLDGPYANGSNSSLELPEVDLALWSRASLVFRSWMATEEFWDGGRVEVSTGGAGWTPLEPNGGYTWNLVDALGGPGFSGDTDGWERTEFDLSRYLGQAIRLRLRLVSDGGIVGPGWYVDDLEVVERQILSVPLRLAAESGADSQVPLRWQPPAGIDPAQPGTPLLGYSVYRSTAADLSGAVRLHDSPLATGSYTDTDVVNGTTYYYAVTAIYAEGESGHSNTSSALPFLATFAADITELQVSALDSTSQDTTITFNNLGTGFLEMNLWLGDEDDTSIDDVRIAYDVPNAVAKPRTSRRTASSRHRWRADVLSTLASGDVELRRHAPVPPSSPTSDFVLLYTDASEPGLTPDLADVLAKEQTGSLFLKLTGYAPWGNILADFSIIVGLDTDADRFTGDTEGSDFYVVMGAFAAQQVGVPAFVATTSQEIVGIPHHMVFPLNADFLEVGFPLFFVGSPKRVFMSVVALQNDFETPIDLAPNPRSIQTWLGPSTLHVSVPAGEPTPLGLTFFDVLPPDVYRGSLFLETNDPTSPHVTIPVTYLFGVTPVEIFDIAAVQEGGDVVLRWRTAREEDVAAFRIFRSRDGGPTVALRPDVAPRVDRSYRFRDSSPQPGHHAYRIAEVAADGEVVLHGGVELDVVRVVPRHTFLGPNVPNPFNPSTTLRYGLERLAPVRLAIFDARGRLVRTLVDTPSAPAGFYSLTWDGQDDRGRRAASGTYHARLEVGGRVYGHRLTLLK